MTRESRASCWRKRPYTEQQAVNIAAYRREYGRLPWHEWTSAYHCKACGAWHVGRNFRAMPPRRRMHIEGVLEDFFGPAGPGEGFHRVD